MPTNSKKIFIDTNALIYHTFEDFEEEKHKDARITLEYLAQKNYEIYISSQVLREYCRLGARIQWPEVRKK